MKLKLILIALVSLSLYSCAYEESAMDSAKKDTFSIEDGKAQEVASQQKDDYEIVLDEKQAEELNKQTEASQPVITDEVVEIQDRVFFGYDSAMISGKAKEILDLQTQWLNNNPGINIAVEGHCDERGTREYNIALGEKRAHSVKKYLINNGISASRIKTISYGKEKPAFFGNSREIHAKNRRSVVVER